MWGLIFSEKKKKRNQTAIFYNLVHMKSAGTYM